MKSETPITVRELIDHLLKADQDAIVVKALGWTSFEPLVEIEGNVDVIGGMCGYSRATEQCRYIKKAVSLVFQPQEI